MKLPWLIRVGRTAVENPLYRRCIRERQRLVLRQYDGRYYGYEHAAQQRLWEFGLDRLEMLQAHCGSLYFYLKAKQETAHQIVGLAQYLGAAFQMRDQQDDP